MKVGYALSVENAADFERLESFAGSCQLELRFTDVGFLEDSSIADIVDPILESNVRIIGLSSPLPQGGGRETVDYLEKLIIASQELGLSGIILRLGRRREEMDTLISMLDEFFEVSSKSKSYLVLEPAYEHFGELYCRIKPYLGGVFKFSIGVNKFSTTKKILELVEKYFGLLHSVKISNFDESGSPRGIMSPGALNAPRIIKYLVERGYSEAIVIDYEVLGFREPASQAIKKIRLVEEYAMSILEKVM